MTIATAGQRLQYRKGHTILVRLRKDYELYLFLLPTVLFFLIFAYDGEEKWLLVTYSITYSPGIWALVFILHFYYYPQRNSFVSSDCNGPCLWRVADPRLNFTFPQPSYKCFIKWHLSVLK